MLWLLGIAAAAVLAHVVPFPFLLDVTEDTVWRMPAVPAAIYLTFDDGPNPGATPDLLDVLGRHDVPATFFVNDKYLTRETRPILQRMFDEGHAVALHSHTRWLMFSGWAVVATTLQEAAARMEVWTGHQTCRAFRPHAGFRSVPMLMGVSRAGYRLVGWNQTLPEREIVRASRADAAVHRLANRVSAGDIVLLHDGHHDDPRADRQHVVSAIDRLIPQLKARGLEFGTICP